MSYDLFFTARESFPTADEFNDYFRSREHYEIQEGQAWYENGDTSVYFAFERGEGEDGRTSPAFNMNYFRSHVFGLEAAPEVQAFVERFNLEVSDPQLEGMGDGPFTIEGFLRGWNAGNRFAHQAFLNSPSGGKMKESIVYPAVEREREWRWNIERDAWMENLPEEQLVPRLLYRKDGRNGRRAITTVIWADGQPILLPRVTQILVVRDKLFEGEGYEFCEVPWDQASQVLSVYPHGLRNLPFHHLDYEEPPREILDFVRSLKAVPIDKSLGLSADQVLDEELIEEARRSLLSEPDG